MVVSLSSARLFTGVDDVLMSKTRLQVSCHTNQAFEFPAHTHSVSELVFFFRFTFSACRPRSNFCVLKYPVLTVNLKGHASRAEFAVSLKFDEPPLINLVKTIKMTPLDLVTQFRPFYRKKFINISPTFLFEPSQTLKIKA